MCHTKRRLLHTRRCNSLSLINFHNEYRYNFKNTIMVADELSVNFVGGKPVLGKVAICAFLDSDINNLIKS